MKTIAIIGSTGSIGSTTLDIIKKYPKKFKVVFLYADKNFKKLNQQCKLFKPKYVSLNSSNLINKIRPSPFSLKLDSINSFLKIKKKIDYIVSAVSGYDAINLNFKFLKITKNLLIANKETIICGGKIFLGEAKKFKCKIHPIDSEHYCINYFLNNFKLNKQIKNFYLTASGGPFLKKKPKKNISIQKVLKHPNWRMGKKISVNSANLTNKVMELFEAYILFKIPIEKLKIKIENSSKIHSVIALNNGLDFMISHKTTMKIPIQNTLFNESKINNENNVIFKSCINFQLSDPKMKNFPILKTGYNVLNMGHAGMIIFTVLNDRLVNMFLNKKKKFSDIVYILNKNFEKFEIVNYAKKDIKTIKDIKNTIKFAETITL